VFRDLPTEEVEIETPLEKMKTECCRGKSSASCPSWRAGLGFVDGLLQLVPAARGRAISASTATPETLAAVEILPQIPGRPPQPPALSSSIRLLATGHSAVAAVDRVRDAEATDVRFLC